MNVDADFMYGFADAIKRLRPNAKFELYNTEITKWDDSTEPPTLEEIMQQYEGDRVIYEKLEYSRFRKKAYKEYMSAENQLDSLWHAVNSGQVIDQTSEWFTQIKNIKLKYPK